MNVLLTKRFVATDLDYLRQRLDASVELMVPEAYDDASLSALAPQADVLLGGYFSDALLQSAGKLKFAQVPWTGVDGVDFGLLARYGVVLCNSHSNAAVVAEHAVALMLDAAKKLSYHDRMMRQGNWNRLFPGQENPVSPFSTRVTGARVGLVGFGAIGREIRTLLSGFGCSFMVFSRTGSVPDDCAHNTRGVPIGDFRSHAGGLDIVFVAVPLTDDTRGMMDASCFEAMKPGVVVLNVSRGEVFHEADFYGALKQGPIGFCAVDAWYAYPSAKEPRRYPSDRFPFHELDNLVLSPHRAGYIDTGFPHLDDAIENINRAVQGMPLKNVVSLERRY